MRGISSSSNRSKGSSGSSSLSISGCDDNGRRERSTQISVQISRMKHEYRRKCETDNLLRVETIITERRPNDREILRVHVFFLVSILLSRVGDCTFSPLNRITQVKPCDYGIGCVFTRRTKRTIRKLMTSHLSRSFVCVCVSFLSPWMFRADQSTVSTSH